jgi:hypothetical protein
VERPFTDLTLRAEADGAEARVHRGLLATHSRVFAQALQTGAPADVLPLPGKRAEELALLVAWLYREEKGAYNEARRAPHMRAATRCGANQSKTKHELQRTVKWG